MDPVSQDMSVSRSARGAHLMSNGVRLHYLDFAGNGPPVLILPGITSPAITWSFIAERLAPKNRIVVLDIRGRGLSESRPGLGYSLDDYADDAAGVISGLDLKFPIVLGHSMGARIGVRLAVRHADRLAKLVLVDPPVSGPGRKPYPTPLSSYLDAIAAASSGATIAQFQRFQPNWTAEQIAMRLEWLPSCSVEAVTVTHRNFQEEDVFGDFPRIRCPTLLVYAGRATVISDEDAAQICTLISDAKAVRVDAGHMIPWDNLGGFLRAIEKFL